MDSLLLPDETSRDGVNHTGDLSTPLVSTARGGFFNFMLDKHKQFPIMLGRGDQNSLEKQKSPACRQKDLAQ